LILFAAVAGSLAIGIAAIAFTAESLGEVVILEVETVALSPIPTPVPSQKPTPKSPAYPDVSGTAESSTSPPTTSPSVRVAPTSLTIRDLGLSQAVLPVGLDDKGAMEIPNVSDIGWYLHGAAPGMPGATVLVAHVWWGDTPGPFRRLGALDLGASIEVGIGDTIRSYQVVKRTMYDKDELPSDLWRNSGPETLVLITCGGEFDRVTRHYEQNIVVYAVPAQNTTDPQQPT
jgi:LPXTG-site transpeptidase (sortase) family protein